MKGFGKGQSENVPFSSKTRFVDKIHPVSRFCCMTIRKTTQFQYFIPEKDSSIPNAYSTVCFEPCWRPRRRLIQRVEASGAPESIIPQIIRAQTDSICMVIHSLPATKSRVDKTRRIYGLQSKKFVRERVNEIVDYGMVCGTFNCDLF